MTSYTFADVMRITGATKSEMTHWTREGIVGADIAPGGGPGRHRKFAFLNLLEASIAVELNRLGAPVYVIRSLVSYVRWLELEGCRDPKAAAARRIKDLAEVAGLILSSLDKAGAITRSKSTRKQAENGAVHKILVDKTLEIHQQMVADSEAWFSYRVPEPVRSGKYSWMGLTYSFQAGARLKLSEVFSGVFTAAPDELKRKGGILCTSLIAVANGETGSIAFHGNAAVVVSLGAILADLEERTGDSFIA